MQPSTGSGVMVSGASPPDPDHLEYPPPGRESLIGDNGFGVVVKGESMAGRDIHDGDVVWVNPERPYALGKVVLALATSDEGGEAGMVVKTYARTEVGDCLVSETDSGRSPLVCHEFKVIGPAVGITSWRMLDERPSLLSLLSNITAQLHKAVERSSVHGRGGVGAGPMDPLNVSVEEAARLLGIGVTSTKALIRTGKLLSYHEGRRRVVPVVAIREYQEEQLAAARAEVQAARAGDWPPSRWDAARPGGRLPV